MSLADRWGKWFPKMMFVCLGLLMASLATSIAGTSIFLGICLGLALLDRLLPGVQGWRQTPLDESVIVLTAITFLSSLFGLNPSRSMGEFWGVWLFLIYYFCVWYAGSVDRVRTLLTILLAVGGAVSAYAIVQHYTGLNLFSSPTSTVSFSAEATRYISRGTFNHHQTFANVYFLIFCLAFSLALTKTTFWKRLATAVLTLSLALALVFSYTRGIWLASLMAILLMAFFRNRRAFTAMILAIALIWVGMAAIPSSYSSRARSIFNLSRNVDRLVIWEASWGMLRDHALLGIGLGNYPELQEQYLPPLEGVNISSSHAHNSYLQLGIERGFFALAAFAWMWYVILRIAFTSLWRLRGQESFRLAAVRGAAGGIIGFLIDGFFQNNYGDSEVLGLAMFLVAIIVVLRVKQAEWSNGFAANGGAYATP